jgi:hypothetical protein
VLNRFRCVTEAASDVKIVSNFTLFDAGSGKNKLDRFTPSEFFNG